ncbi:MAG: DUF1737 domain-containing protein [Campylobacteraceae bacterium]|jgi:hypothetical protein|nr:DUF1737 domain-containing protein [Campylobacteraceae bacterium]
MAKIIKYLILREDDQYDLIEEVLSYLADGYELQGGVSITQNQFNSGYILSNYCQKRRRDKTRG